MNNLAQIYAQRREQLECERDAWVAGFAIGFSIGLIAVVLCVGLSLWMRL